MSNYGNSTDFRSSSSSKKMYGSKNLCKPSPKDPAIKSVNKDRPTPPPPSMMNACRMFMPRLQRASTAWQHLKPSRLHQKVDAMKHSTRSWTLQARVAKRVLYTCPVREVVLMNKFKKRTRQPDVKTAICVDI